MSIKKVEMYTVQCDNCGKDAFEDCDTVAWKQKWYPGSLARETLGWIDHEGKDYCPECTTWNEDETVRVPK